MKKYGTARQATDDNIILRIAWWMTKATVTHPEYVILIAFPRQQLLRERASMLSLHVHCLSCWRTNDTSSPQVSFLLDTSKAISLKHVHCFEYHWACVINSLLCRDTALLAEVSFGFSTVFPGKCWSNTSLRPRTFVSKFSSAVLRYLHWIIHSVDKQTLSK
jgi:hypothetical protein